MLERSETLREARARDRQPQPELLIRQLFRSVLDGGGAVDARFVDSRQQVAIGAGGITRLAPVLAKLLGEQEIYDYLHALFRQGRSVLVQRSGNGTAAVLAAGETESPAIVPVPVELAKKMARIFDSTMEGAGRLNEAGHHLIDPRAAAPGPHFFTNLLLGNRIDFRRPLQTTPKSVVDHLGRGSFRSHAATQVLATRWDFRPEENGFPANRQFYLVENGRQIFYSADPGDPNVVTAQTEHAPNYTTISYLTSCGLEITRAIFLLQAEEDMPLATEVHSIVVHNHGATPRQLRLVITGMFGPAAPNALWEDVVYTNVSMQGRVLRNASGDVIAVSPHYHPKWTKGDERFHTMIVHHGERTSFPTEFGTSYNEFVGEGTLERPEGIRLLSNRLARKGPGFFALGAVLNIPSGDSARADNFTGLVSAKVDPSFDEQTVVDQVAMLVERYRSADAVPRALAANIAFFDHYRQYFQVRSDDPTFDCYVNHNLPFQILYQTFVSRSFDQTQKGYREIGFREVQDLFASLPFFTSMGRAQFAKDMLKEWAGHVWEFGFADHNFYWEGKEPGDFSDDALWLVQAVEIYLNLTDDIGFLDEGCAIAGKPGAHRTVYQTMQAILRYSGEISVGKHGLPLLDRADWNDTLRLDPDYLNGPQKEAAYLEQLAAGGKAGEPLKTDNCESVMNAFLLKIAIDATRRFAERRADNAYAGRLAALSARLAETIQRDTWKSDYFARVLINRGGPYSYLGAQGDGLSSDPALDGTYFLNSFSWSVLAGVAAEEQIRTMLATMKRALRTAHGLRLCSPVKFAEITSRGGSAEYFPGDRENGGVFKHADMMAAVALLKSAKTVDDPALAAELRDLAYEVIDVVIPYRTMSDPYVLAGNPRFCTQYNNSETGENVGPTLSGTSTWLWLALSAAYGIELRPEGIALDPLLRDDQRHLEFHLRTGQANYHITITKPQGFYRRRNRIFALTVDGKRMEDNIVPRFTDGQWHEVDVQFDQVH